MTALFEKAEARNGMEGASRRRAHASSADLTAILTEVTRLRAGSRRPTDVLHHWERDACVRPATLDGATELAVRLAARAT